MSARRPRRRPRSSAVPPAPDDWTVADGDEPTLTRVEGPTALAGELAKVARRPGWGERLGAARVRAAWEEMVGAEVAVHCEPVRLAGRVLVVRAATTAWATQLRYLTEQLIERADAVLGPGSIREVRITVGPLEGDGAQGGAVQGRGGRDGGRRGAPPAPFGHPVEPDAASGTVPGTPPGSPPGSPRPSSSPSSPEDLA